MDGDDPIRTFFPDDEDVDLYAVLSVASSASADEIKKAYRRAALVHHPDKHASASEEARAAAALRFQQIGFAYAVLGDEARRAKYDATGATAESALGLEPGEDGWEAYFEQLFDRVTRGKLDEMKKAYQGSAEEVEDVKAAYTAAGGSVDELMRHVPHSTHEDEPRLIALVDGLVAQGTLPKLKEWERSARDEKARLVRERAAKKEAAEAEALARDLGVWDEFYGSGKEGTRRGKGRGAKSGAGTPKKGKGASTDDEDEGDTAVLQALILKRKKNMDGFFDSLAAKYAEPEKGAKRGGKGKKRSKAAMEEDEEEEIPARKRSKAGAPAPPEIDDAEFEALQAKLFGDKAKASSASSPPKAKKGAKGRKAK